MTTTSARPLRIGITPLTDCAAIAVAQERGFFARHGVRAEIVREPSWANIRDKLAAGALEAAHMLAPMPLAATLGVGPVQEPLVTALSLGLGGNAITVSSRLRAELEAPPGAGPAETGRSFARLVRRLRAAGAAPLRLGTVFPVSMHSYELRWWLAAAGIVPDRDVQIAVVPPPRMVDALEARALDGFCVGEPWNCLAVQRGSGVIVATKQGLWSGAPEKVLGVRRAWAEEHHELHQALLRALLEAAHWCDDPGQRPELARLLAAPAYVGTAESALLPALVAPEFLRFERDAATFPWRSHALWMLCQMLRWGQLEKPLDLRAAAADVYRTDLHREAARALGLPLPATDEKPEGPCFDGTRFDPRAPVAWLRAQPIHALRVDLDELEAAQSPARE